MWCPALLVSPIYLSPLIAIHLSPLIAIHLSPSVAGCVRLYVCLQFICFPLQPSICLPVWLVVSALWMSPIDLSPLIAIHLSPSLAGGVRLSGCLQFICLPLQQFICLPVWLGVSGSTYVSNSFVSLYSHPFVSQSGWWCRLSGCLQFICRPL